ncbi:MAG: RAMP superfamily CRISPR-associated protein [Gammaproteobacteria bacterium]
MPDITWNLSIYIAAPLLTQSASYRRFGLDAIMARSPEDDALIIPGTLITGKLRHAWMELAAESELFSEALKALGHPCTNTKENDEREQAEQAGSAAPVSPSDPPTDDKMRQHFRPGRKWLTFSDLRLNLKGQPERTLTRIKIDERRGAAAEGALRVIEQLDASGAIQTFEGSVCYRCDGNASRAKVDEDADKLERAIRLGLDWVIQLGSGRSTGFGPGSGGAAHRFVPEVHRALLLRPRDPARRESVREHGRGTGSGD